MLVALTVRRLKPDSFDDFKSAFIPSDDGDIPSGWKRFHMVRSVDDPNEVITFGFFDGSLDDFRGQDRSGYDQRISAIDQYVDSVVVDGVYELVEERSFD